MRRMIVTLFCLLYALPAFASTPAPTPKKPPAKPKIVVSFSILGDLVRQVSGDTATIVTLVGPNADAHVYEPTPETAASIADAHLIVVNGLGFEGWLARLISASGFQGATITATKGIAPLTLDADGKTIQDPHAWQSVANVKLYIATIRNALVADDPGHAELYKRNAQAYLQKLDALDAWVKAQFEGIPAAHRKVITSHDAFGYFARDYHVEFLAAQGLNTESQPSAGDTVALIRQIRAAKVTALFLENISDPRMIEQLQRDGGATIGGTLYSDALSLPDGPAPNYIDLMKHNVTLLVQAMKRNPAGG